MKENILSMENRDEKIIGGSYVILRSDTVKRKRICAYIHRRLHGEVSVTVSKIIVQSNKSNSTQDILPW